MLLEQNDVERSRTNTDKWHKSGYTGKGVHIVFFDIRGTIHEHMKSYASTPVWDSDKYEASHGTNTIQVAHQFAPDAKITFLVNNRASREWFAKHAHEIDIVNISMSTFSKTSYTFLEQYSHIPVFCSSGNDSRDRVVYPAKHDFTIAVGAYEDRRDALALYSNGGEKLDVVGFTDIYIPNCEGRVFKYNGTSTSSPQVAGSIACYIQFLKENNIEYDREDIRQFIHNNAIDIEDEGFDIESGHGLFCLPSVIPEIKKVEPEPLDPIVKEVINKMKEYFKDVPKSHWAHGTINQAKERGILNGYPDGTFKPNEPVKRSEFAAGLNGAINYILNEIKNK